jgi:tetratricopeptide (TPR) repeat protein
MKNFLTLCLLLAGTALMAQIKTPAPSPAAKISQTVGLTEVSVEYNRPAMRGRTIFGDLVPYGKKWRTGANASSKITLSEAVQAEGRTLRAGSYAIFTVPGAEEWEVIFYRNTETWGIPREWDEAQVATRFMVKSEKLDHPVEYMTFDFADISYSGATLELKWEKTRVPIKLTVNTDETVVKAIDKVMAGPSASDYFAAGRYYHESGKDLNMALEYVQKANSMDPKFWTLRTEALIYADMGRTKDAIAVANRSTMLAKEAGNEDYVRMNEASIAQWSK